MKIVVVGAGAMGSIYAALLSDAGHDVWILDPWRAHRDAIASGGLRVEGASGDRTVTAIQVAKDSSELPCADLYIIATKASGVADAAQAIRPSLTKQAKILTIQNGLGSGERIAQFLDANQVFIGVAEGFGASIKAPGHVQHTAMKMIRIGAFTPQGSAAIEPLARLWSDAGFSAEA